mgnify:CR=1 FL=1
MNSATKMTMTGATGPSGARKLAGKGWDLLKPATEYPEVDDQPWERGGNNNVFPHPFGADSAVAAAVAIATPYLDSLTMDVALEGVKALRPGYDRVVRRLVKDLDAAPLPDRPIVPFMQAVHDRLRQSQGEVLRTWCG